MVTINPITKATNSRVNNAPPIKRTTSPFGADSNAVSSGDVPAGL